MPPAPTVPTTSPNFPLSNECGATCSRPFVSRTHNSMNWPPIRCRWPTTTLSSFVPKRTPMTSLQQKLHQLNLATMSLHLDQMLTDATAKNLSLAQTLESLVDRELEARHQRSIERRFKLSRLHSMPSIRAQPCGLLVQTANPELPALVWHVCLPSHLSGRLQSTARQQTSHQKQADHRNTETEIRQGK